MPLNATRESTSEKKLRIERINKILKDANPQAKVALHFTNPWELLVAVILSAQCTDIMVNKVTAVLFQKYRSIDDYLVANPQEFEQDIKSTGFYHNKAKNVLAAARMVKEKFGGAVPKTMEEMLTIPGVARKTANVVLGNAYGVVEGIAVDTHVSRLSQRLRLVDIGSIGGKKKMSFINASGKQTLDFIKDADPVKIEKELMASFPKSEWFNLTYRIIDHGRAVCKAQKPDCGHCVLHNWCPASRV